MQKLNFYIYLILLCIIYNLIAFAVFIKFAYLLIVNSLVRIAELSVLVFCCFLFIIYIISMLYFGIGCAHVDLFSEN